MTTLNDLFKEYLHRIEPQPAAVKRAKKAHGPLRDDLSKDKDYGPFVMKTLLSGSYGRETALLGIKDVDVIIETSFTEQNLTERAKTNETLQHCLLRLTQEAIERTDRAADTKPNRRSIQVELPAEINDIDEELPELTLDIVPVRAIYGEDVDSMKIADRDLKQWFDTYPVSQLEDSVARNRTSTEIEGRHSYKPTVKLMKAWKKVHYGAKKTPKGFSLECMTAKYHNPQAKSWGEAVRDLFTAFCNAWPNPDSLIAIPTAPDISNISNVQIPITKTLEQAKELISRFHRHKELIDRALEEAETDLDKSARTWRLVFGQDCEMLCFPLPGDLGEANSSKGGPSVTAGRQATRDIREAPRFG